MNRKIISGFVLGLFIIAFGASAHATNSDVAKEKRWAEQVIDGLLDGDELWLNDGSGHEFLGILTEGDTDSGRAVILVHGIGVHPNWPDVIYPLREVLLDCRVEFRRASGVCMVQVRCERGLDDGTSLAHPRTTLG